MNVMVSIAIFRGHSQNEIRLIMSTINGLYEHTKNDNTFNEQKRRNAKGLIL
jgi:hypothetical protein